MVSAAFRRAPRCLYRNADGAFFSRGRLLLFRLELARYHVSSGTRAILHISFTSGLLTLRKSAQELSEWALSVYGRERYYEGRKTLGLGPERFPRTEGHTLWVAPFVSRDYRLRNYAETDVMLFISPDIELIPIEYRSQATIANLRRLEAWLGYKGAYHANEALRKTCALLLQAVKERIAKRYDAPGIEEDLLHVCGRVCVMLYGAALIDPSMLRPLDQEYEAVAQKVYDEIVRDGFEEMGLAYVAGSLLAAREFYRGYFDDCVTVATHVIANHSPAGEAYSPPGEAYRIRGLAHIAVGKLWEAKSDFETAARLQPNLLGLREPLEAVEGALRVTTLIAPW